jgi:hypothetical protein
MPTPAVVKRDCGRTAEGARHGVTFTDTAIAIKILHHVQHTRPVPVIVPRSTIPSSTGC